MIHRFSTARRKPHGRCQHAQRREHAGARARRRARFEAWEAAEDAPCAATRPWSSASMASRARSTCCWRWRARRRSTSPRSPCWRWPSSICGFIAQAQKLRLELAADYLVMAAWLAYLKSQLLLPREAGTRGPADRRGAGGAAGVPAEAAGGHAQRRGQADDAQAARTRRVRARHAGGRAHHPRAPVYGRDLRPAQGLCRAAPAHRQARARGAAAHGVVDQGGARAAGGAGRRVRPASGCSSTCSSSSTWPAPDVARTALASSFGATLEMAREGLVEISQAEPFAPIYMRKREEGAEWQRVG